MARAGSAVAVLVILGAVACLFPRSAYAVGGSGCKVTSCSAPTPTCATPTTTGLDSCGGTCSQEHHNACSATTPTCATPVTEGTYTCGGKCSRAHSGDTCNAPTPACGETTTGTRLCTGTGCTKVGAACSSPPTPSSWVPYGNVLPGDPTYGFPNVTKNGSPLYPDPSTSDLVGFAAKGNIIVGDYTAPSFQVQVVPQINGSSSSKTQPYAIDRTDEALGYHTGSGGVMYDPNGLPLFDGNYDQQDTVGGSPGMKLDGRARKFYESSLSDAAFQSLLSMPTKKDSPLTIMGVLFTNHAMAGFTSGDTRVVGAVVARDEVFIFDKGSLEIDHDSRLVNSSASGNQVALPYGMKRPVLASWKECNLPTDCPSP